jgi:hypothetical protein
MCGFTLTARRDFGKVPHFSFLAYKDGTMRLLAACFLLISMGSVTVYAQGQPEIPGNDHGRTRIDLERLHRIAERAKPNSQIDPSRAGALGDAHRSRNSVADRFARQLRDKNSDLAERFRDRVREGQQDERRELSRDRIRSRFDRQHAQNEPHRLALRQRLALVDRMRDEALTRQDWEALGQADQLERKIRNRFTLAQGEGIPMQPLPSVDLANDADFIGPGYGRLTASSAREQGNEFGQRVAEMARNRQGDPRSRTGYQVGDGGTGRSGSPGTGGDGSPGTGGDGFQLDPPQPPPPPPPPIWKPRPEYPRLPPEKAGGNSD